MLLPVLIAMLLNTTYTVPRRTSAPIFRAFPPSGTAIPMPYTATPCSFLGAGGAEGWLMPAGQVVSTYCRGLADSTNLNSSFVVTKMTYDAGSGIVSTVPTGVQSGPVASSVSLRWTHLGDEGWMLLGGGGGSGPSAGGNGGGNGLYYIPSVSRPSSKFELVHNGSSFVFQDVQATDLGLFVLAQQLGGSGTSLVRSGLLWWNPDSLPRGLSAVQWLPGSVMSLSLQAFLAPSVANPIYYTTAFSRQTLLQTWAYNSSGGGWFPWSVRSLASVVSNVVQIVPKNGNLILMTPKSITQVSLVTGNETLLESIPLSVNAEYRSIAPGFLGVTDSPSPSASATPSPAPSWTPGPSWSASGSSSATSSPSVSAVATSSPEPSLLTPKATRSVIAMPSYSSSASPSSTVSMRPSLPASNLRKDNKDVELGVGVGLPVAGLALIAGGISMYKVRMNRLDRRNALRRRPPTVVTNPVATAQTLHEVRQAAIAINGGSHV